MQTGLPVAKKQILDDYVPRPTKNNELEAFVVKKPDDDYKLRATRGQEPVDTSPAWKEDENRDEQIEVMALNKDDDMEFESQGHSEEPHLTVNLSNLLGTPNPD